MIKRLRNKFIFINMTIVTVMLVVIFSLVLFFMGMNMEIETQQQMQELAEMHRRPSRGSKGRDRWQPNLVVYVSGSGEVYLDNNGLLEEENAEDAMVLVEKARAVEESYGIFPEEQLRYIRREQPFGESFVFLDISGEVATMENLFRTCLFIGSLSFLVFFAISFYLAKWAVKPVETAWNQQRQFVADASHELKTPLTVIMTNAELLQSPEYEEQERSRFAESILTMSHQMRGLVESLLELARVDNGAAKMVFSLLDLSQLTADSLLPFEPVFFEKDLLLESNLESGLFVKGSEEHLHQVVDILLDNAAKYSASGGTVRVALKRQGSGCLLSVSNPGEEIGKEDLKIIFKRFYRIDKARAMNHSYGLGLAIADSVVKEHGGKIWAESEKGVNTFFVQLPAL